MLKKSLIIIVSCIILSSCIINLLLKINNSKVKDLTTEGLSIKKTLKLNNSEYKKSTGKNITIAIIDSGFKPHKDIQKNRISLFIDFVNNKKVPYDNFGHGTFIAGIIGANGNYTGIAQESKFVILKVTDDNGFTDYKTFLKSIEWINNNAEKYNIKVVNISIGFKYLDSKNIKYLNMLLKKIRDKNIAIIAAAGNEGPAENSILYPGASDEVLCVGYIKNNGTYTVKDDYIGLLSSRGTYKLKKPDIVTCGVNILSLNTLNGYTTKSGSSFSTAIITGVIADIMQTHSDETISSIENILKSNTVKLNAKDTYQGYRELLFKY